MKLFHVGNGKPLDINFSPINHLPFPTGLSVPGLRGGRSAESLAPLAASHLAATSHTLPCGWKGLDSGVVDILSEDRSCPNPRQWGNLFITLLVLLPEIPSKVRGHLLGEGIRQEIFLVVNRDASPCPWRE